MARYRKIDTRMWGDEKFRDLSSPKPPSAKYLWIFLLTGPHTTNLPGLFRAGEMSLAEELGWPLEGFRKGFAELFAKGLVKADWRARVVWIPNAIKYNQPDNPNVVKSWRNSWDEIPECPLKSEAYEALKVFTEGLGEGFGEAFREGCGKGLANQEQEQEQEQKHDEELKKGEGAVAPCRAAHDAEPVADRSAPLRNGKATVKATVFTHPSLEEVTSYCRGRRNHVDPQQFLDHYLANGWKIGRNQMKDWKAAVRTWERNDLNGPRRSNGNGNLNRAEERQLSNLRALEQVKADLELDR